MKVKRWRGFRCLNRLVKLQKIIENPACLIFLARLPEKYDTPKEAVDYELFQHILHYSAAVEVPLMESYAEPPPVVNRGEDTWTPFQEDFEYLRSKLGQTVRSPDKKYRVDVDEEPYLSDNNSQRNIRWKANSASSNQYAFSNSNSRKRSCFLPVTGSRPLTPHAHAQLMDGRHYRVNPAADTCSDFIITSYRTPSTSWFRKHPSSSAGG
ncbi:hypothetical protein J6590_101477 [Homalodisca vitripennis]|nr:hypothetical protein J6590_101477 [Homalodisca vitripennis]